ncbi:MAG: peroxiredoxin family protein [Pseudomonadota bacterium]
MRKSIAALLLSLTVAVPAFANPAYDLGPATGTKVPSIGMPQDETGKPRALESLMGEKGVVLFFFRSAAWCPYCQLQLMDLNGGLAAIEKRGYHLAGISYEPPAVDANFIKERGLKYTLLSDPKSEIIDRYKLRDPQYKKGSRAYGVPQPIIFVLDRDGVVKAKLYEDTFQKRPPVGLVVETLDKLASGKTP